MVDWEYLILGRAGVVDVIRGEDYSTGTVYKVGSPSSCISDTFGPNYLLLRCLHAMS